MVTFQVQPRDTPADKGQTAVEVEIDEALSVYLHSMEEWVGPRSSWELTFREGHEFDRANNVEVELLFVGGEQTSSLSFRAEQLDALNDTGQELMLRFEERDGITKLARLTANGLHVELFHILTFT